MLRLPVSVRVFVCLVPVDMRRSFDGLAAAAEQVVGETPLSGHLFVFRGRRGDRGHDGARGFEGPLAKDARGPG